MNPLNLHIVYLDGNKRDVSAIAADLVAFETHFDLSIARLEKEIRLTHLFYLAWPGEKRTKNTELEFEPWCETVQMVSEGSQKK